jgi:glutathione synthase/RimK-type ligase-like ATP-grasp enzyme
MHVFFEKVSAMEWLSEANFPLVFKLRSGAGSSNVYLLKDKKEAYHYLEKMFSTGMKSVRPIVHDFKTKMQKHASNKDWIETLKRLPKTLKNLTYLRSTLVRERNYFLVQDYLPENNFDTRVTIIGSKAFAFRRYNRSNDFKASGSGKIEYSHQNIDKNAISLAFQTAHKLKSQSMAFDIIYNQERKPLIIEMSYVYVAEAIFLSGGYWDLSLIHHNESLWPEDVIIQHVLESTI